jgi:hypothetical protein
MFSFRSWWRRIAAASVFSCLSAMGAPPSLTTIQDTLYKADGTRFSGTVTISWTNFNSADQNPVPIQSITQQIVNGTFKVQLIPTTTASAGANYTVKYSSEGKFQYTEIWAVPPSTSPLKIRDVRVGTGEVVTPLPLRAQVEIADVNGLAAELNVRPTRGAGYTFARAAVISASGQLDAASGNLADCVRVDGSSGPCGATSTQGATGSIAFADAETPLGAVDGVNLQFTVANVPQPAASLALYRNGILMKPGADFVLGGNAITFSVDSIPQTGDLLTANYRYGSSTAAPAANFVDAESPSGAVDGSNASYTLGKTPTPVVSLQLYRNGILMRQGVDYDVSGSTVVFRSGAVPQAGDLLQASYRY